MLPRRNTKKQLHRVTVSSAKAEFLYANGDNQRFFSRQTRRRRSLRQP
ncbi:hypothetical protein E3Z27_07495 [Pseudomonas mediterranea]|nr:hypothetical protein E3Z27_07495 [Pseudomonas mediterranea]